jgi:cell growth-regulating nucleolar protein
MFRVFYPKTGFCAIAPSLVVFSFCLNEQRPTPASIISHVLYLSLSSIDSPDYESTNTHTLTQRERKREREKEMVWFQCDDCGDSIKKPALKKHFNNCSASRLSCVDCGQEFDRYSVQQHTSCVTEHEKYALGATKPGGKANYAANGGGKGGGGEKGGGGVAAEKEKGEPAPLSSPATGSEKKESIPGREFLATEAPWMCTCCNVECTGAETLKSHALGKKHKRKAKTLRAQKEEEKKNEGKPKLNPAEEKKEKKKEKKEKKARKKVIQLANKEKKKEILQEKLKAQREKKARKEEKKRKRDELKTDEEKAKDAEKAKEKEAKKAKRLEVKAIKREKKLARKKAKQEAKKNGRGKTNAALSVKGKGVKKKNH